MLEPANKMGVRKGALSGFGNGIMWLIIHSTYGVAFWYGIKLILEDRSKENPEYTPAVLMIVSIHLFIYLLTLDAENCIGLLLLLFLALLNFLAINDVVI